MDIKRNRNQTDRILPRNRWKTYLAVSQTPNPASSQLKQRPPTEVYDILCTRQQRGFPLHTPFLPSIPSEIQYFRNTSQSAPHIPNLTGKNLQNIWENNKKA